MHKNNPFLKDYDFTKLVQCHPQLKSYIFTNTHKKVTVKFSDPKAVKALNTVLFPVFGLPISATFICLAIDKFNFNFASHFLSDS